MPSPSRLYNLSKKVALWFAYKLPPVPGSIHGKLVWIHSRALFSFTARTFFRGEGHVRTWLMEQLKPGSVFFDIGAHHGWVSMWTLPLVGEDGRVFSFEPSPANLSILEWHRRRNKLLQWKIIGQAVSDKDSSKEDFVLVDAGDSPTNSLTTGLPGTPLMEGRNTRKVSVSTITVDTFCSQAGVHPDLMKIDVEGAELFVLRGARKILREKRPDIILAVHPFWLPPGQSTQQILEFLREHDYAVYNSAGRPVEHLQADEYLCLGT